MLRLARSQQNTHTKLRHSLWLSWHMGIKCTIALPLLETQSQIRYKLSYKIAGQHNRAIGSLICSFFNITHMIGWHVSVGCEEKLALSQALLITINLKLNFFSYEIMTR